MASSLLPAAASLEMAILTSLLWLQVLNDKVGKGTLTFYGVRVLAAVLCATATASTQQF